MRDADFIRKAVSSARRQQAHLAQDRLFGHGQLGDAELTSLLMVPYPTVAGQKN